MAASDSDEDESMLEEHKHLLDESLLALSEGMNTDVVLRQLMKREIVDNHDKEQVLTCPTTAEKNTCLLDKLKQRGPAAFNQLLNVLMLFDPPMAQHLLPVRYRILWFAPNPRLAAMVEYTLSEYYNVSFSNIEGRKSQKKFLQKRGRVFKKKVDYKSVRGIGESFREEYVKYSQDCEIVLTFPIVDKTELVDLAIEEVLKENSSFDMFVMSGVCEGVRSDGDDDVRGGEVVIATEAYAHPGIDRKISLKDEFIEATKKQLITCFKTQPSWAEKVRSKLPSPIGEHPRLVPHFGSVCSSPLSVDTSQPSVTNAQFLASDSHTFKFYEQCQKSCGRDKPWFSCLGVRSYTSVNNEEYSSQDNTGCSMASTGVTLEVCRVWYQHTENK